MSLVTLAVAVLLAVSLRASAEKVCNGAPRFIADTITSTEASTIEYYFTENNINNVPDCARFCYETQFCNTAIFDSFRATCAISYNYRPKNCRRETEFVEDFQNNGGLTCIHCATCDEGGHRVTSPPPSPPTTPRITTTPTTRAPTTTSVITPPPSTSAVTPPEDGGTQPGGNETNSGGGGGGEVEVDLTDFGFPGLFPGGGGEDVLERIFGPLEQKQCFEEQQQKVLVNAAFTVEYGLSLESCKCLCASSWLQKRYDDTCHSLQYYPTLKQCHLNRADHTNPLFDFSSLSVTVGSYWSFPCRSAEHEVTNYVLQKCEGILPPIKEGGGNKPSGNDGDLDSCFESVPNYLLIGLAGGLEHDVSLSQCKCLCATSKLSGRYNFECKSAMYYRGERDCVLNLDDRSGRPDLFRKDSTGYDVTYLGVACSGNFAKKYGNGDCDLSEDKLLVIKPVTDNRYQLITEAPNTNGGGLAKGGHSDDCFTEIRQHVLRGMATAIESGVSLATCKCLCLYSQQQYGFVCRSLQFYFDTNTCLVNRETRLSKPRRFTVIPDGLPHSYFDHACLNDDSTKQSVYAVQSCKAYAAAFPPTGESKLITTGPIRVETTRRPTTKRQRGGNKASASTTVKATKQTRPPKTTRLPKTTKQPRTPKPTRRPRTKRPHTPKERPATTPAPTTTTTVGLSTQPSGQAVPDVTSGRCRYSAFYESMFRGTLIEKLIVASPQSCFQACIAQNCRSANLIQFEGIFKHCELFSDSASDYRTTKVVHFDNDSTYFEGIQCRRGPFARLLAGSNNN